ncbi:MAG: efflux RND transporter periplasmic adaptor subunit [Myxococcales bacterium]|nr:efflux RND transporter periplasmic adaptor subunit [Myxococcales bacterium]
MSRFSLILALAAVAGGCSQKSSAEAKAKAVEAPVKLALVTVEEGPAPVRLTLTGMVAAEESSDVASSVPGRVVAVLVERGAEVKFGDPLVRLDASSASLSAQSVRAQLAAAQAQERLAADECKRAQALLDKGAITRSQYDREITNCTAAAQTVAATKAQLGLVSKSISDGVVRAPFAGRVDGRWVSPGEFVAPGMRLVTLVDDDPLKVEMSVPEAYVPKVELKQAIEVRALAFPDASFPGTVTRIGAEIGRMTRSLTVEAVLAPGSSLTPGMFAEVTITVDHAPMAIVPAAALVKRGTTWRLFAVVNGRLEERVVQRGPELPGDKVALIRGAVAGEQVASPIVDAQGAILDRVVDGVAVTQ